jgi:hypothetical protein
MTAVPYTRVCVQGTLPGGEVWSINPAFIGNFDDQALSHADIQNWADDVAADVATHVTGSLKDWLSSVAVIRTIVVQSYGTNGRLEDSATAPVSPGVAGGQTLNLPPTTAAAISLYSGIPGRSYRGRVYWPILGATLLGDSGRLNPTACASAAAAFGAWMHAIENVGPTGRNVVLGVWSKTRQAGVAVNSINIGDVPDGLRRRKDALTESRSVVAYPPA